MFFWWNLKITPPISSEFSADTQPADNGLSVTTPPNQTFNENSGRSITTKEILELETPEVPTPTATSETISDVHVNNSDQHSGTKSKEVAEQYIASQAPSTSESATIPISEINGRGQSESISMVCQKTSQTVKNFYAHLDRQPYIQSFNLTTSSELYFSQLIQRLHDNPPVVSGERSDLFTILQNTAHFFRIIGKENITILKGIIDMEKDDKFESVLADFYTLILLPECAKKNFSLNISETSLYDYAGFFLNTMGGRLYLFRRDSLSRIVVSYYALLLIDRANTNASNSHGIEIQPPLDLLIEEIESTANPLQLREHYLDTLFSLKEKYQ